VSEAEPQTEYSLFDSEAQFQSAVDRLLAAPGRELRVFDPVSKRTLFCRSFTDSTASMSSAA
jgi:hypothetical protein